jgi:V/A-type H+-transporting ATPase subunit A
VKGRVTAISGATVTVALPGLRLYERLFVGEGMLAGEVVRLEEEGAVVQVYEETRGLAVGEPVVRTGKPLSVNLGPGLLGTMFDGLERPLRYLHERRGPFIHKVGAVASLDLEKPWLFEPRKNKGDEVRPGEVLLTAKEGGMEHAVLSPRGGVIVEIQGGELPLSEPLGRLRDGTEIFGCHEWPVREPRPFGRKLAPSEPLITGQRVLDFLFPVARGGTAILPGGFGTGKTILEQCIAKFADVDIVLYVGCGERGNEMAQLIEEFAGLEDPWTGRALMERTIMVVNTSNMPVAARESSIYTAVTMAEYYRDMGYHVLLLADSLSRWAGALREISSALGEMPAEEGYPTYLGSRLSDFFERSGVVQTLSGRTGSLTMMLSLSPPGGDFTEPVTQACQRVAGALHMLDTSLAQQRHFPAINWSQSYSLYERELARRLEEGPFPGWESLRSRCMDILAEEASLREITELVGFEGLQDADRLTIRTAGALRRDFLQQNAYSEDAFSPPEKTVSILRDVVRLHDLRLKRLKEGEPFDEVMKEEAP